MYYTTDWKYKNDGLLDVNFPEDSEKEARKDEADTNRMSDKYQLCSLIKKYNKEKNTNLRCDENVFIGFFTTDELIEGSNRRRYFLEPRSGKLAKMHMIPKLYDIVRDSFVTDVIENPDKAPFHEAYEVNIFNLTFIILVGFYDMKPCIDFACEKFEEFLETYRYADVRDAIDRSSCLAKFYYRFISHRGPQSTEYFVLIEFHDVYSRITTNFVPPTAINIHRNIYDLVIKAIAKAVNSNQKKIKFEDVRLELDGLYEEEEIEEMVNVVVRFVNNNICLEPMIIVKEGRNVYKINNTLKHFDDIENDYFHYNIPVNNDGLRLILSNFQEKYDDLSRIKPINYCNEHISLDDRYKAIEIMKKYNKNIKYNNASVYLFAQHYFKYEKIQERIRKPIELKAINMIMSAVKRIMGLAKYNINQCLMKNPKDAYINKPLDISRYSIRIIEERSELLYYQKPLPGTFRTSNDVLFESEQCLNISNEMKLGSLNLLDD